MDLSRGRLLLLLIAGITPLGCSSGPKPGSDKKPLSSSESAGRLDSYGDSLPPGALARLGTVRFRQAEASCVVFSPDGKLLASGGAGKIALCDPATGKGVRVLAGHPYGTTALSFNADGTLLASGGFDAIIRLWDPATGNEARALRGHTVAVLGVAFSPDGKLLASAGQDDSVRVWDPATGRELQCLGRQTPGTAYRTVAFSPDGTTLAAAGTEGIVRRWNVRDWTELTIPQERQDVRNLAFSCDGKEIVSVGFEAAVRVWAVISGKETRRLADTPEPACCLAVAPDDRTAAVGDREGTLIIDDLKTGKERLHWKADRECLTSVAFSPDGKTLASTSGDAVRLWDPTTGKRLNPTDEPESVEDLAFSPDGRRLAAVTGGAEHESLRLWDADTHKGLWCVADPAGRVRSLAFAPDGKTVATGQQCPAGIRLWDAATGAPVGRFTSSANRGNDSWVNGVAFSPDGDRLASGWDGDLVTWNPKTGQETQQFKTGRNSIGGIVYAPNGRTIICGGERETLSLWDAATGEKLREFSQPIDWPHFVAISPDGRMAAARGGEDRPDEPDTSVRLWETLTGKERCRLPVKTLPRGAAFSPDGRVVVTGESDGCVCLWDAGTGKELRRLTAHRAWVAALAFSPDGRRLATGSADCTVLIWDLGVLLPPRTASADELSAARLEELWTGLASDDAGFAYRAMAVLSEHPRQAAALFKKQLCANLVPDHEHIARLIAELDDDNFDVRDKANHELAILGRLAEPALRNALNAKPSPEQAWRVRRLLGKLARGDGAPPESVRGLRAVEALERTATPAARDILKALAEASTDPLVASAAQESLDRLSAR